MATTATAAAFFDLDRTLISGSSVYTFGRIAWNRDLVSTTELLDDAWKAVAFRFRGSTDEGATVVRDRILGAIEGVPVEVLEKLGDDIIPRLLDNVRDEAQGFLDLHAEAGRDTYMVTASPIEIVARLATALGMTGALATVAEIEDGRYAGRLAEPFCYGPGKAMAIERLAQRKGYNLERCYAYSDSASDLPMMEIVGHPVAVNPDRTLERIARERGWPVVEFSRTAKKAIRITTAGVGSAGLATATCLLGRYHQRRKG